MDENNRIIFSADYVNSFFMDKAEKILYTYCIIWIVIMSFAAISNFIPSNNKYDIDDSTDSKSTTTTQTKPPCYKTVYITRTGECYHRSTCQWLYASKIPICITDAISRGYRACKVCNP